MVNDEWAAEPLEEKAGRRTDPVRPAAKAQYAALLDALRSGRIRHAGLDVFHAEPLKPDHPLAQMENVTLTAHAAFRTLEASMTLLRRAIDIVRSIIEGKLN